MIFDTLRVVEIGPATRAKKEEKKQQKEKALCLPSLSRCSHNAFGLRPGEFHNHKYRCVLKMRLQIFENIVVYLICVSELIT